MAPTRRAVLALPLLAPALARAQAWPTRPVRIIVSYPPGGATDVVTRKVAEGIAPLLGQAVVVENRPGGSGTIGTAEVARAIPDGHTMLGMDSSYSMLPYVFARLPWDHARDIVPVALFNFAPVVLVVKANARWRTLGDLLAEAKANPGKINYGSGGVGSSLHFAGEALQQAAGVELFHVPFKGAAEATLGVLSGTVDLAMGSVPSAISNLRAGTVRALAVCGRQRVGNLPEAPTFAEQGIGFEMMNWTGLAAPRGVPGAVVEKLSQAVAQALRAEAMQGFFRDQGALPGGQGPAEFGKLVRDEVAMWQGVATRANLTPQ